MAYDSIIPDAFPNLYADQWRLGVQQLSSRLESYVNTEVIHGEGKRYQKLPSVAARQITTRFGDTNPDDIDVEGLRKRVTTLAERFPLYPHLTPFTS